MISPLQTWQHSEPKGLWLVLGGLAVLTHIGIIGMSVPYLVSLTQPGEEGVATIPIEFIVMEAVDESDTGEVSAQPIQRATAGTTAVEPALAKSDPVANVETSKQPQEKADSQTTVNVEKNDRSSAVEKAQPTPSVDEEKPELTPDPVTPESVSSSPKGQMLPQSSQPPPEAETPEAESEPESVEPEVGDAEPEDAEPEDAEPEVTEPEVIAGEPLVPPSPESGESGQAILMRIGGFQEDVVQDAPDVLPVLESDRNLGTKRSEAEGCGPVELPVPTVSLIYRLRIGTDGTVELATLQPGRDGWLMSEAGGRAIACLIETSEMTFSPAMFDGEAKLDDSLLVTFELTDVS